MQITRVTLPVSFRSDNNQRAPAEPARFYRDRKETKRELNHELQRNVTIRNDQINLPREMSRICISWKRITIFTAKNGRQPLIRDYATNVNRTCDTPRRSVTKYIVQLPLDSDSRLVEMRNRLVTAQRILSTVHAKFSEFESRMPVSRVMRITTQRK